MKVDPNVSLIRIEWACGLIWNVAASCNQYGKWYVTGLEHPCLWDDILEELRVLGSEKDLGPYTVSVTKLL